jgi:hypothetical protein
VPCSERQQRLRNDPLEHPDSTLIVVDSMELGDEFDVQLVGAHTDLPVALFTLHNAADRRFALIARLRSECPADHLDTLMPRIAAEIDSWHGLEHPRDVGSRARSARQQRDHDRKRTFEMRTREQSRFESLPSTDAALTDEDHGAVNRTG